MSPEVQDLVINFAQEALQCSSEQDIASYIKNNIQKSHPATYEIC